MLDAALPQIFLVLMGVAILVYAILDGYDLGVGMLLPADDVSERDRMIASIGPFWDANETWLVLAVGILLIAFPHAHSLVLRELYIPAVFMLIGLILRGVAFDFRAKALTQYQRLWDRLFKLGSALAALSQGYMLGLYVMGFEQGAAAQSFAALSAVCVAAAYAYIGGAWLVMKSEGELQRKAALWSRRCGWLAGLGILSICIVNPMINPEVAARWFTLPEAILLLPIPLACLLILAVVDRYLKRVPLHNDFGCWIPFVGIACLFTLCLLGLAYSFYPWVVPNRMLATEAASATASLRFIFWGVLVVLPIIACYTVFSYWVFRGKSRDLSYY